MAVIVYNTQDTTLTLNGRNITTEAEGDTYTLTPVNPATSHVNAANGGVSITNRVDAAVHDLTIRVQKAGVDDVFLNNAVNNAAPVVFNGSLVAAFSRDNSAGRDSWTLSNGSITTRPTQTYNNQDGNALMEYVIRFRDAKRLV